MKYQRYLCLFHLGNVLTCAKSMNLYKIWLLLLICVYKICSLVNFEVQNLLTCAHLCWFLIIKSAHLCWFLCTKSSHLCCFVITFFDNIVKAWELQLRSLQLRRWQVTRREKSLTLQLDLQRVQTSIKISFVFYLIKHGSQSN